jgi:pleiotropic regulator 1
MPTISMAPEVPVEGKTLKALTMISLKRTFDLFNGNHGEKLPQDIER